MQTAGELSHTHKTLFYLAGVTHLQLMVNHLLSLCSESLFHGCDMKTSIILLQKFQNRSPQVYTECYYVT